MTPGIAEALEKLKRFHAVVKANGSSTVSVDQLVRSKDRAATQVQRLLRPPTPGLSAGWYF